jgi:hypothetical protein
MDFELTVAFHTRPCDKEIANGVRWIIFPAQQVLSPRVQRCSTEADFLRLSLDEQKAFTDAATEAFALRLGLRSRNDNGEPPLSLAMSVYCAARDCSVRLFAPGEATLKAVAMHQHVHNNCQVSARPWALQWTRMLTCANPVCAADAKMQFVEAMREDRDSQLANPARGDLPPLDYTRVCARCGTGDTPAAPFKRCGHCKGIAYCSETCQAADWAAHKPVCRPVDRATWSITKNAELSE